MQAHRRDSPVSMDVADSVLMNWSETEVLVKWHLARLLPQICNVLVNVLGEVSPELDDGFWGAFPIIPHGIPRLTSEEANKLPDWFLEYTDTIRDDLATVQLLAGRVLTRDGSVTSTEPHRLARTALVLAAQATAFRHEVVSGHWKPERGQYMPPLYHRV